MNRFFLSGMLLVSPFLLNAQQVAVSDTVNSLKEVVVTASRRPSLLVSSPYSAGVLHRKDADDFMYRSTPEALMAIPGVFVQKTNHGGGSPFVRGLTGNQTLILVDGIRMNNSTFRYGPNQYLNTIDPFTIHRVEVVKGSGSVQYGSDALGGVIQVLTHEPHYAEKSHFSGMLNGRYWSADMEKTGRGQVMYSSSKFAVLGGLSLKDFGAIRGGKNTGIQAPSGYDEWDADLKLKWKIASNAELIAAHQAVRQENVPVFHKVQLENFMLNEMDPQTRSLSYLKLNLQNASKFYRTVSVTGSYQQSKEGRNSQKNESNSLRKENDVVKTSNASVDFLSELSRNWTANTGLEYYYDKIGSSKEDIIINGSSVSGRGLYPDGATYGSASIYSLHHVHLNKFNFEAGLRYNRFSAKIKDETLGNVEINPDAFVINTGLNYRLGIHHFYGSFSSGYRAPNIDDMGTLGIVDFRYEIPSAGLQPEKNYNTEIGYKVHAGKWKGSLALYHNRLNDLISRVKLEGQQIEGYPVYKKENLEKASIKGLEASVQWKADKDLLLNGFVSYNYGKNISKDEPLRRIPPLNGNASLRYSLGKLYLISELAWAAKQTRLAQGDKDDNRIPEGGTPGWQVLNVFGGYKLKFFEVRLSAQNLFNEDYRTHGSGINGVGRSMLVSGQVNF